MQSIPPIQRQSAWRSQSADAETWAEKDLPGSVPSGHRDRRGLCSEGYSRPSSVTFPLALQPDQPPGSWALPAKPRASPPGPGKEAVVAFLQLASWSCGAALRAGAMGGSDWMPPSHHGNPGSMAGQTRCWANAAWFPKATRTGLGAEVAAAQDSLGVRLQSGNHPENLPLGC